MLLTMSAEDKIKLDCITQLLAGKMERELVRQTLRVSDETVRRYLRGYEKKGLDFLEHGNARKVPKNKIGLDFKSKVQALIQERYFDFNVTHLQEILSERENLNVRYETLRKWVREIGLMKRPQRRHTKAKRYRERMSQRGFMIQMDGSPHRWFANQKTCLIACIDDATSDILGAEFFESEDTLNCMKVVKEIIARYGIFKILYVDRAGIFGGMKRQQFAQMKRACEELGIRILYAPTPEAKGRVERLFQTLQDRLIAEMRLENIKNFAEANAFLQKEFIPHRWRGKFTVSPESPETAFTPLLPSVTLDHVFCIKDSRVINKDHTIHYGGELFALDIPPGECIAGHTVEIREHIGGYWSLFYRGVALRVRAIKRHIKGMPWYSKY